MKQKKDIDIRLFIDAVCEKKILKQFHEIARINLLSKCTDFLNEIRTNWKNNDFQFLESSIFLLFKLSYPLTYCVSNKRNSILFEVLLCIKIIN